HGNTSDMLTPRMPAVQCGLLCHLAVPQSCRSDAADCGFVLPLMQLTPQTVNKLQNAAGFGFHNRLHHQLATAVEDSDHYRFLVHVHADILDVATHSCLLGGKIIRIQRSLSLKVKCHPLADLPIFSSGSCP